MGTSKVSFSGGRDAFHHGEDEYCPVTGEAFWQDLRDRTRTLPGSTGLPKNPPRSNCPVAAPSDGGVGTPGGNASWH